MRLYDLTNEKTKTEKDKQLLLRLDSSFGAQITAPSGPWVDVRWREMPQRIACNQACLGAPHQIPERSQPANNEGKGEEEKKALCAFL